MADEDREIDRLVAILAKDEDDRDDADWDVLAAADPDKLKAAGTTAGLTID